MGLRVIKGDLVEMALRGDTDVMIHGCNCFCQMGRGIALQVKGRIPQAYEADQRTVPGDRSKLGTFTYAEHHVGDQTVFIVNAYTQYHWKDPEGKVLVDYDAVRSIMKMAVLHFAGNRIAMPLIGAGLARGDWATIERIILEELGEEDITIVHFDKL